MSVTRLKLKNQICFGRPCKAKDKAVEKTENPLSTSGANLMYAGYPYDPYAQVRFSKCRLPVDEKKQTRSTSVTLLILVVDDEPDVEVLFRQQFRHDLRAGRFTMEFALSGDLALQHIADAAGVSIILILSDINMPGMTGLELSQGQGCSTRCAGHNDHCLWRCGHQAQGIGGRC